MGGRISRIRLPHGLPLWATLVVLLLLGMATTVADLMQLPAAEATLANADKQRAIIDPGTGAISLGIATDDAKPFDVATGDEAKTEASAAPNTTTPDAPPVDAPTPPTAAGDAPNGLPALRTSIASATATEVARSHDSLTTAPAPEVTEIVDGISLPKRGENNVLPSTLYAHYFKQDPQQMRIAIVVMDAGLDSQSVPLILGLPNTVTVAFSPYARKAAPAIENLRNSGFETWAVPPSMGEHYPQDDPGPLGLISSMPKEELDRRLHVVMGSVVGSVGMVLPPDETITTHRDMFAPILSDIDARGLLLLSTHATHSMDELTNDRKLQHIIRRADLVLDPVPNEALIQSKLAGLASAATAKGDYIVVTSARPQTLLLLANWLRENPLPAPLALAPLSAMYQEKEPAPVAEKKPDAKPEAADTKKPDEKKSDAKSDGK